MSTPTVTFLPAGVAPRMTRSWGEDGGEERPADDDNTRLALHDRSRAVGLVGAEGVRVDRDRPSSDGHPGADWAAVDDYPHLLAERQTSPRCRDGVGWAHASTVAASAPISLDATIGNRALVQPMVRRRAAGRFSGEQCRPPNAII